jgi:nicotinamidase/pyrazinamidase
MNALLLIDIQNDFLPGGALAVPDGHRVVPVVNRLQPCFDIIVATRDWHPADHGSFAANHPGRKVGDQIELHGLTQILWPTHCVQGTAGADFAPDLDRTRWARVFVKGTDASIDSYSGFYDNGHRQATGLGEYLRERQVTDLYVAGLATDYCVKFTVLDALQLGFKVHLIEDACRGVDLQPDDVKNAIETMKAAGAEIITAKQLETTTLFRPVGPKELDLIARSDFREFPPRLPDQPIFYPVLNEEYARQIARDWNVKASGAGYVTRFQVTSAFLNRYPEQIVGGAIHRELWIPAEDLAELNRHIVGLIEVVAEFHPTPPSI